MTESARSSLLEDDIEMQERERHESSEVKQQKQNSLKDDIRDFFITLFLFLVRYIFDICSDLLLYWKIYCFSAGDVYTDFRLAYQYLGGETKDICVESLDDPNIINTTSPSYANATTKECFLKRSLNNGSYLFDCTTYHYHYGAFTLLFNFLPAIYISAAFLGKGRTLHRGLIFVIVWGIIWGIVYLAGGWGYSWWSQVIGNIIYWQGWAIAVPGFMVFR